MNSEEFDKYLKKLDRDLFSRESEILDKFISEVLSNKGGDYSGDKDRLRNFKLFYFITNGKKIMVTPLISCLIRLLDKIQRLVNLEINQVNNVGEKKLETLLDLVGYSKIAYIIEKCGEVV